ncbi:SET domain [Trinorchestia longiramus]|nr:SET domain [Trinorchestia longiramus]
MSTEEEPPWSETDKKTVPPHALSHLPQNGSEKWEIIYREPYGRCMVAKVDIAEGELLYEDHPTVHGPKQNSDLLCLGCYSRLFQDTLHRCSKCTWPLCSPACELKGLHPLECAAFVKTNFKFNFSDFSEEDPVFESILPLRCLMLRETDPKKWNTLRAMEPHDDLRRGSELWKTEQIVCDFLREKLKLKVDDALCHSVSGVLDVNCHEVQAGSANICNVRGMYPLSAMMSHDCFSNTHHTFTDELTMHTIASQPIKKGDQITGTYTHLLSGTTERRKHLRYGKFFDCVCSRCSDPTELGTFFSALKCTRCGGTVLCKDPLHPLNKADYQCTKCGNEVPVGAVSRLTNSIYREVQEAGPGDLQALETIFSKYEKLLHPNHFHLIGLKHSLSQMYGRSSGYLIGELTEQQLERKIDCCTHLLNIIDVIDPGISRLRGLTKYELHAPLLMKANKEFQLKLLTRKQFLQRLHEVLQLLHDTVYCLQFEPPSTHEGQVCAVDILRVGVMMKLHDPGRFDGRVHGMGHDCLPSKPYRYVRAHCTKKQRETSRVHGRVRTHSLSARSRDLIPNTSRRPLDHGI